jgi:hypothetical protein
VDFVKPGFAVFVTLFLLAPLGGKRGENKQEVLCQDSALTIKVENLWEPL